MSSTTHSVPTQQVPAWKRLGLKLKGPASDPGPAAPPAPAPASGPATASQRSALRSSSQTRAQPPPASLSTSARTASDSSWPTPNGLNKRKSSSSYPGPDQAAAAKKPRRGDLPAVSTPPLRRQKSVSFATDTKVSDGTAPVSGANAARPKKGPKPKGPKPKKSKGAVDATPNVEPALAYLNQWHTSRDSWKFNKNYQSLLIKHALDPALLPAADFGVFLEYIRDIKGFVRTRLREAAQELKKTDMEQGAKGFPTGTKDVEGRQAEYEKAVAAFLQQRGEEQGYNEAELVRRTADLEVQRRVTKRARAEMVLEELSDCGESATTTATTSASGRAGREAAAEKREIQDGGEQPRVKRRRKARTDFDDSSSSSSSSSSESESDSTSRSDDDSSDDDSDGSSEGTSSSSSSDSGDDEIAGEPNGVPDTTSSSSSSSSDGSGSETDSDGDADDVGDVGDSEESDSNYNSSSGRDDA